MAEPSESEKPAPAVPPKEQPVADFGDLMTKLADPETMKELEANDRRIKEIRNGWVKFEKHVVPVWHEAIQKMSRDIAEIKRLVGADQGDGSRALPAPDVAKTPSAKPDQPDNSGDLMEQMNAEEE